jgi:hypothetical protein
VARAALSLLQAIQSDGGKGLEALRGHSVQCVPILLETVKAYYSNDEVRNLAALLLTPLVTSTHVSEALRALKPGIAAIQAGVADEQLKGGTYGNVLSFLLLKLRMMIYIDIVYYMYVLFYALFY